jgi:hypothetical protein
MAGADREEDGVGGALHQQVVRLRTAFGTASLRRIRGRLFDRFLTLELPLLLFFSLLLFVQLLLALFEAVVPLGQCTLRVVRAGALQ